MVHKAKSITLDNVEALLSFLPVFEDPEFHVGELVIEKGYLPYWEYNDQINLFIEALYDNGWIIGFDWPEWQKEAERYWNNPDMLEEADIRTIQKLLTTHVRKDRFCDGHLAEVISNGHIVAILRRLKKLSADMV